MALFAFLLLLAQNASPFWTHWGDGKAELSSYTVTQSRYGQPREATTTLIYVTEPFYKTRQVKAERPRPGDPDVIQVLKLNRVKKFRTGIYDYSLLSSVFAPVNDYKIDNTSFPKGSPLKITFSGQEWCGMVFHQLNRRQNGLQSRSFSYFDNEGDTDEMLSADGPAYFADELFIAVRELLRPFSTGQITLYQTLENSRLFHTPLVPLQASVSKKDSTYRKGRSQLPTTEWTITAGTLEWRFTVDRQYPRIILAYQYRNGATVVEHGVLKATRRLPYWELNDNDDERYAKDLGVK